MTKSASQPTFLKRVLRTAFLALVLLGTGLQIARPDTLSNNLSNSTTDVEPATGDTWLTASFKTGSVAYTLDTVTLLLANTVSGASQLDIYRDDGLEPGSLISSLTHSGTYSSGLTETAFTAGGITLASNSTYWIVLRALSGEFDWAWTSDNSGTGVGVQHTWGESNDGGLTWFTYDIYPTQFRVTATPTVPSDVPEPGTFVLMLTGCLFTARYLSRKKYKTISRKQQHNDL